MSNVGRLRTRGAATGLTTIKLRARHKWQPDRRQGGIIFGVRSALREALARPRRLQRRFAKTIYGSAGSLQVRLAGSRQDVHRAQRLRYQVFYEEMSARSSVTARMRRRDEDSFDAICDHLLVVDSPPRNSGGKGGVGSRGGKPVVVGTYRILRSEVARRRNHRFYTESEFEIKPLLTAKGPDVKFMEVGRSCVLSSYRNRRTVELLWHGLWTYVRQHNIDIMIGCASFEGTDPEAHAMALSYLHHNCLAPSEWRAAAYAHLYQPMDLLPAAKIDDKAAMKAMPPLIKAYLRLGAFVGDGAVVDTSFGTTDVLIVLPVNRIDPRYFAHFGAPDETTARLTPDA